MNRNPGLFYALAAYTLWGIAPIFWKQIVHIDAIEIVMHRMIWSFLLVTILIFLMRQSRALLSLLSQPKLLFRLSIASLLVSGNWAIFIWAVNDGRIVQTSMGYFISPLLTVLFGIIFFQEHLRRGQLIAVLVMAMSVFYLIFAHGELPWVALSLSLSFALYSLIKKTINVPATHGLAVETALMFLPALGYLLFLGNKGQGEFGGDAVTNSMLALTGLLTLTPLLLFSSAAKRISMTALGMTQYVGPTLQLFIGVFLYNEAFEQQQLISFGLIWFALLVYSLDQVKQQQERRKRAKAKPI